MYLIHGVSPSVSVLRDPQLFKRTCITDFNDGTVGDLLQQVEKLHFEIYRVVNGELLIQSCQNVAFMSYLLNRDSHHRF